MHKIRTLKYFGSTSRLSPSRRKSSPRSFLIAGGDNTCDSCKREGPEADAILLALMDTSDEVEYGMKVAFTFCLLGGGSPFEGDDRLLVCV